MGRSEDGRKPLRRRTRGYHKDQNGQWWAYIYTNGRQHNYRCASEAAAKAKRKALEAAKEQHIDLASGKMRLHDWLQHWLSTIVAPNKKPKTLRFYRQMCEFYISPRIGHIKLDALTADHIRLMLAGLKDDEFSERTCRHAYTVLRTALTIATKDRKIIYNPILSVEPPRVDAEKLDPMTEQEAAALLGALESHRLYALYVLAIELGIRKGELLGLEISGLDLDARTITIAQQVLDLDGKPSIERYTKNNRVRTLPLTARQCAILRARLEQIVAEGTQASSLLFASESGTAMSERNLDRHFKAALKRARVRDMHFHTMRHTCLSWLGDTGAGHDIIQAVAGHADADVTATYIKVQVAAMREALERVEAVKVRRAA
jgi:integrase